MTRGPRLRAALRSRAFKLGLSAALLAALLFVTDLHQMRAAVAAADPLWLGVALLLYLGSQLVSGARWWLLTRAVGFDASLGRVIAYYFSGIYLNLFTPGTVSGDVGRGLFLAEGSRRALALTTVVAHRATGFVALVWVAAAGIVGVRSLPIPFALRALAALAVPLTLAAWLIGPRLAARLLPPGNRWRHLVERELAPYWHDHRLLGTSLAGAAVTHLMQIGGQLAVSRALGLTLPWAFFWVVAPLLNAGGTLPFTFNGVGLREAGYWYALSGSDVGDAPAIGIGLLTSAVVLATGLSGLPFLLLVRPRRTAPAARSGPEVRP
ncbi:MAG: lysylphosphatidylglycerol synthase transmembrane domain-containing protein [Candidatus Binatia bacterium]